MTEEKIDNIGHAVASLRKSTDALTIAVKGSQQRNRQFHITIGLVGLVLVGLVIVGLVLITGAASVSRANRDTNHRILSCTEPRGTCYERGQRQTTAAVTQIFDGIAREISAAVICQRKDPAAAYVELLACISRQTRATGSVGPPSS